MDNLKDLGKRLRKTGNESNLNIRRQKENFPQIERISENMNPNSSHVLNFMLSKHPHNVKLNLYFSEPERPCHPEPLEVFAAATADCPSFDAGDAGGMAVFPGGGFFTQIGGFTRSLAGITVPISGYYELTFTNSVGGVNVVGGSFIKFEILVGGATVAYQINTAGHGYFPPLSGVQTPFFFGTVAYISAGTVVTVRMSASGIAFLTPSDFCGFLGGQPLRITLVGGA